MEGERSSIEACCIMRSTSTNLSELPFSYFPRPSTNSISPQKTYNMYDDYNIKSFTLKEEPKEGSRRSYGGISRKSWSANPTGASRSFRFVDDKNGVQSMMKRAFSMRKTSMVGEEHHSILDHPFESLINSSPPPDDSQVRRASKRRSSKMVRACRRLLGFS